MGTLLTADDFAPSGSNTPPPPNAPTTSQGSPSPSGSAYLSEADFASDPLPSYANGQTPETAINKSPLDLTDRAALSVGNEAGKMAFLKQKFQDVRKSPSGDLLVKDQSGLWKRVNPDGLGDGDAWDATKEIIGGTIADHAGTIAKIGSQVGAAAGLAVATGGASLLAQAGTSAAVGAAVEGGLTSLGRLAGTYDATPEEQLKDVGIEAAMNFGGTYVAAGIKPTISYVGKGLQKFGERLADAAPESRQVVTNTLGALTGTGAKPFETLIDNPDAVKAAQVWAHAGGVSSDDAITKLGTAIVQDAATVAKSARPAASALYDDLSREVVQNAPANFQSGIKDVTNTMLKEAEKAGLGTFDDAGKFALRSADEFGNFLKQQAVSTGELSALAADKQSTELIRDAAGALMQFQDAKELTGAAGAKQLLNLRKIVFDTTYRLKEVADDAALAPAQRILAAMKEAGDGSIYSKFELPEAVKSAVTGQESTNLFQSMNEVYHETVKGLQPLMRAAGQAAKQNSDVPFQSLSNQLLSSAGRNNVQKSAVDQLIDLVGKRGGDAGAEIASAYQGMQVKSAAAALSPVLRPGLISKAGATGAVAAAAAGNPLTAMGVGAATVASSPRLAQSAVQAAMKGKAFLSQLSPAQLGKFVQAPEALQAWGQTILGAPAVHTQVVNQLMQGATRQISGGQ